MWIFNIQYELIIFLLDAYYIYNHIKLKNYRGVNFINCVKNDVYLDLRVSQNKLPNLLIYLFLLSF